jgi:rod shape-determining protein MreB
MPLRSLGRLLGRALALDPGSRCVKALVPGRPGNGEDQTSASGRPGKDLARASGPGAGIAEIPSLVARVDPGRAALLGTEPVGEAARVLSFSERPGVTIVSPIERGAVADPGAAEKLFAHVFSSMLDETTGRVWASRPRVICGVGAGLTEVEQRALADALDRAGARQVHLVPSLVACACALEGCPAVGSTPLSGRPGAKTLRGPAGQVEPGRVHLVAELGHGRTGVGLASGSGVLVSRSVPAAACDLDLALSGYLRRRGLVVSTEETSRLREGLGLPAEPVCREDGPSRTERVEDIEDVLPRHVGAALAPLLELIVDSVREVLAVAPGGVVEDLLEEGLVLAGGPAATPGIARAISHDLELPARIAPDPAHLRVRGLALVAEDEVLLGDVGVRM